MFVGLLVPYIKTTIHSSFTLPYANKHFFHFHALFALASFQQSLYPFSFLQTCWDFIRLFSKFYYWICRGCSGYFSIHMLYNVDQDGRYWPFLPIYISSRRRKLERKKLSQYFHEESQEFFANYHRIWYDNHRCCYFLVCCKYIMIFLRYSAKIWFSVH